MALSELIDGQTIKIDNHNQGSDIKWSDNGIHLHKRMNSDKFNGANVIIPLSGEGDLSFSKITGQRTVIEPRIVNEIKRAFNNRQRRDSFIKSFHKSINIILQNDGYNINDAKIIAEKSILEIAKYFGLKPKIQKIIGDISNDFYAEIQSNNRKSFIISTCKKNKSFTIGYDLDIIKEVEENQLFQF